MEREFTTIELPVTKKSVTIKKWLTGREYEELQRPIYDAFKTGKTETPDILLVVHKAIEVYVVSVGDKSANLIEIIRDLPYDDYDFIVSTINELKKKL